MIPLACDSASVRKKLVPKFQKTVLKFHGVGPTRWQSPAPASDQAATYGLALAGLNGQAGEIAGQRASGRWRAGP